MKLLTKYDIAEKIGKKVRTIENWLNGYQTTPKDFPEPIKMGNSIRWKDSDIDEYINSLPQENRYKKNTLDNIFNKSQDKKIQFFDQVVNANRRESIVKRGRGRPRKIQSARKEGGVL